ncbi:hypothetical protein EVAR_91557_1 [Eumeta japonica]|uniref:Uncharacterized protein n=1 Tax=Eumeta variegata TaxID=151549 RepID=A0A4C1X929_EUMVA|nr:hypothetical protein EVAR_91557_1 [Eumeta japonica]
MAVEIAAGAVVRVGGSEGLTIGRRSRRNLLQNAGLRWLPYKATNLFLGRILGKCCGQLEAVAQSLTHYPCMGHNRYTAQYT